MWQETYLSSPAELSSRAPDRLFHPPHDFGEGDHAQHGGGVLRCAENPSTAFGGPPPQQMLGRIPTLSELFAAHSRDAGWAGFLLAQVDTAKPLLWVQERMAILESGRVYPPGLPTRRTSSMSRRAMPATPCGRWRRG